MQKQREIKMRVFLFNSKLLSEINRKEEMTEDTYLITDQEADLIQQNLDNNGHFWVDENKQLRLSGKAPNTYSDWNNETHTWVVNQSKLASYIQEKKQLIWEEIKKEREKKLQSGVKMIVNGEPKWFHTDVTSQLSYDRAKTYLETHKDERITWKTMDNTYVQIGLQDLIDLTDHIFVTGQRIFQVAEQKKHELDSLTDPSLIDSFDIKSDWGEVYLV